MPDMFDLAENVAKAEYHVDTIYRALKANWDIYHDYWNRPHDFNDLEAAYDRYIEAKLAYKAAYEESKK